MSTLTTSATACTEPKSTTDERPISPIPWGRDFISDEVLGISVERHLANAPHRHKLFGPELGGVEYVEWESELVLFFENLDA